MNQQQTIVVPYTLAGGGDIERFFLPLAAHRWLLSVTPGSFKIPPNIIEDLRPFAAEDVVIDELVDTEFEATTGSYDNDVALTLAEIVHGYESQRAMNQDVVMNGWKVSEEEYVGVIY